MPPISRWLRAALASAALVGAVTGVIALLEPRVPALGLGVLYLLAVLPIALAYGATVAVAVSVASMAAFNFFFLPPRYNLDPGTSQEWSVLAAFLVSSLVVSHLAVRSQRAARQSARLADEQAALRRVATLVARGVPPPEVFAAVAREVGLLLDVDATHMARYEPDGTGTGVAAWSPTGSQVPVGTRVNLDGESVAGLVLRTGRPARMHDYGHAPGPGAALGRELGLRSSVGAPIAVDQRLWGVVIASSKGDRRLPADADSRLENFSELVATAIANAEARTEVAVSRARIVAATDAERRRVVRDLHDGAQQRMVHTTITLELARRALQNDEEAVPALLTEALDHAKRATAELRELAHGILPAALTQGGLRAGVDTLASRMPVPVEIDVSVGRLPTAVEATAYFVIAEALTNVAKHARADHAEVTARIENGTLGVRVRDDGVGGAQPHGSGLIGLADRLAAIDGQLQVDSPADGGTLVAAAIPLSG